MRQIRTQITIAIVGLVLVGALLYSQSLGLAVSFTPAPGGTFVEGVLGTPHELNPLLFSEYAPDRDLARLVYAGMIRLDSSGQPAPDLAESWAVSADGLSYTFVLRSGLRWHDGVPLSLDDVIFTIGLLQAADYAGPADVGALWQQVSVAKLNATTLKLTLPEPYAPFLDHTTFPVLPAHKFSGIRSGDLSVHPANESPVGAGPFRMERLLRSEIGRPVEVLLSANPYYHGPEPMLSYVRMLFFPNEATAVKALLQGEIMGVGGLSNLAAADLLPESDYNIFSALLPEYRLILLNQQNAALTFFRDKKVRQALLAGLNRERLVDEALVGQAVVASGPILPGTWAYSDKLRAVDYDPLRAADSLRAGRWLLPENSLPGTKNYVRQKNGKQLAFDLLVPNDARSIALGQMAVEDWAQLGVRVSLKAALPATIRDEYLEPRRFQAIMVHLSLQRTPDPDPYSFWHQTEIESGQNYSGYDNRSMSELLEQARTTPSSAARARLYRSFQARFMDETPALLLHYPVYSYAVSRAVNGVQLGPLLQPADRFNTIADWYIIIRRVVGAAASG
jgi:peptide/nickel transport system substrate-binding protein